jgi:hypothetical protein
MGLLAMPFASPFVMPPLMIFSGSKKMLKHLRIAKLYNVLEQQYQPLEHGSKHGDPNNSKPKELRNLFRVYVCKNRTTNGKTTGNVRWWLYSIYKTLQYKPDATESQKDESLFWSFQQLLHELMKMGLLFLHNKGKVVNLSLQSMFPRNGEHLKAHSAVGSGKISWTPPFVLIRLTTVQHALISKATSLL